VFQSEATLLSNTIALLQAARQDSKTSGWERSRVHIMVSQS